MLSSDPPEIPSGGFMKTALFQPSLPEPYRHLSMHTALQGCASTSIGLIPLRFAASTAPVGFCPPSPAPLPPVLGIPPGIRVLRVLCGHAGRPVSAIPSSHVSASPYVGVPFTEFPDHFGSSEWGVFDVLIEVTSTPLCLPSSTVRCLGIGRGSDHTVRIWAIQPSP
jgi:hypothetical protein